MTDFFLEKEKHVSDVRDKFCSVYRRRMLLIDIIMNHM